MKHLHTISHLKPIKSNISSLLLYSLWRICSYNDFQSICEFIDQNMGRRVGNQSGTGQEVVRSIWNRAGGWEINLEPGRRLGNQSGTGQEVGKSIWNRAGGWEINLEPGRRLGNQSGTRREGGKCFF